MTQALTAPVWRHTSQPSECGTMPHSKKSKPLTEGFALPVAILWVSAVGGWLQARGPTCSVHASHACGRSTHKIQHPKHTQNIHTSTFISDRALHLLAADQTSGQRHTAGLCLSSHAAGTLWQVYTYMYTCQRVPATCKVRHSPAVCLWPHSKSSGTVRPHSQTRSPTTTAYHSPASWSALDFHCVHLLQSPVGQGTGCQLDLSSVVSHAAMSHTAWSRRCWSRRRVILDCKLLWLGDRTWTEPASVTFERPLCLFPPSHMMHTSTCAPTS